MTNSHNCLLIPSDNIKVTVLVLVNGIGIFDQVMNSTKNLLVKMEINLCNFVKQFYMLLSILHQASVITIQIYIL